jgi:RNA polymerase sigma-70 factor (ECF subfamily)
MTVYLPQLKTKELVQQYPDEDIIKLLGQNSDEAVELLFKLHYTYLCKAAYRIIPNSSTVEDLVQDVFFEIWKKKDKLNINTSIKAYLRKSVVNKALNYIRSQRLKFDEDERILEEHESKENISANLEVSELQLIINKAIEGLPEKCRIIFSLSRFEELSYQEISEQLGISKKTVENQISKALRILREHVNPYLLLNDGKKIKN